MIGVESSGGLSVSAHTMEKCGFFPALMIAMIMSETRKSLSTLKAEVLNKYGQSVFVEEEVMLTEESKKMWQAFIQSDKAYLLPGFVSDVAEINNQDGLKLRFSNEDWVLLRLSGTEPVARIYAESDTLESAKGLITTLKNGVLLTTPK